MPYIKDYQRIAIASGTSPQTPGELNYAMTLLAHQYLAESGVSYTTLNEIIGAFESAKLEFYRRKVVPYEEQKIAENGDL